MYRKNSFSNGLKIQRPAIATLNCLLLLMIFISLSLPAQANGLMKHELNKLHGLQKKAHKKPKKKPDYSYPEPCGIYTLSSRIEQEGTLSFAGIRDYSFIRGFVLRTGWSDIEKVAGEYDFSAIDAVLSELEDTGQYLTLQLIGKEPEHIADQADDYWIWHDPNPRHTGPCTSEEGCKRPLPWDQNTLVQQQAMLTALAEHTIVYQNETIKFVDHPLVDQVLFPLIGWGRIRELGFQVEDWQGYDRELLIMATLDNMQMHHDVFPKNVHQVMIWPIKDDANSIELWRELYDEIAALFGDPENPSIIVLQENLKHAVIDDEDVFGPIPDKIGEPITYASDSIPTGLQMLTSWDKPFTNIDNVINGSPVTAMQWAEETWGTQYFELYTSDADAAVNQSQPWLDGFEQLSTELCSEMN